MSRKPKFNPEITRVKLNPEQAVLTCTCWTAPNNMLHAGGKARTNQTVCQDTRAAGVVVSDRWEASTGDS